MRPKALRPTATIQRTSVPIIVSQYCILQTPDRTSYKFVVICCVLNKQLHKSASRHLSLDQPGGVKTSKFLADDLHGVHCPLPKFLGGRRWLVLLARPKFKQSVERIGAENDNWVTNPFVFVFMPIR